MDHKCHLSLDSIVAGMKLDDLSNWCIPCGKSVKPMDYAKHIKSEIHYMMVLATGFSFDGMKSESDDEVDLRSFYYCLVCKFGSEDKLHYKSHLTKLDHCKNAAVMTRIFKENINTLISESFDSLGLPSSPSNLCEICNMQFYDNSFYNLHLKGKFHRRLKLFCEIMDDEKVKELLVKASDFQGKEFYSELRDDNHMDGSIFNNDHVKSKNHVRLIELLEKNSHFITVKKVSKIPLESRPLLHYCHLCRVWCVGDPAHEAHLERVDHKRKLKKHEGDLENEEGVKLPFHCMLCQTNHTTIPGYVKHLNSQLHIKVENFLKKFPNVRSEILEDRNFFEHFSQSPYHCRLCDVKCTRYPNTHGSERHTSLNYWRHLHSFLHIKIRCLVYSALSRQNKNALNVFVGDPITSLLRHDLKKKEKVDLDVSSIDQNIMRYIRS